VVLIEPPCIEVQRGLDVSGKRFAYLAPWVRSRECGQERCGLAGMPAQGGPAAQELLERTQVLHSQFAGSLDGSMLLAPLKLTVTVVDRFSTLIESPSPVKV
jgi:hypothetical protein